jgi:hypothetical protein
MKSTQDLQAREIGRWQSKSVRKALLASVIAAAVMIIGLSLFKLVWFRGEVLGVELEFGLLAENPELVEEQSSAFLVFGALAALATIYLAVRASVVGASLAFDRPVGHALLFATPRRAYVNIVIVLGFAVAMLFVGPEPTMFGDVIEGLHRESGAYVLVGAVVVLLLVLAVIARDRSLAATQDWEWEDPGVEPAVRRERPLTRPPLAAPRGVDANPFRAAPHLDLRGKTIKPPTPSLAAPVLEDPDAPKPKLLK